MRALGSLVAFLLVAPPPTAHAVTLHVPVDYPTVAAALAAAAAGDTIQLAPGRYAESGLAVPAGVVLRADPPPAAEAWFDGLAAGAPVFTFAGGAGRARLENLAFRNSVHGVAVGHGFDLRACVLERNAACPVSGSDLSVEACTFRDNTGGAITGVGLRIEDSLFEGTLGTAIKGELVAVTGCAFHGNLAREVGGGAIHAAGGSITHCTFVGNRAADEANGGAVYLVAPTTVSECVFLRNHADADGGALYSRDRTTVVEHCRFLGNTASRGGAVLVERAHLAVRHCTFVRNAAEKGGAVFAPTTSHRTLSLEHTVIQETLSGGAIAFLPAAFTPSLTACDLFGNAGGDWVGRLADQYPGNGNLSMDGLFCAEPEDSLFVAASSPLLGVNNRDGVDIGASRVGCHAAGVLVTSSPPGIAITVDGVVHGAPTVFAWTPGSVHEVAAPVQHAPGDGSRYDFVAWSDGGAPAHTVVAPVGDAELVASYDRSFLVTMRAGAGGTVDPSTGFVLEGTALTIRAQPDSGAVFARWTGTGDGAYAGTEPSAVIDVRGPMAQCAHFFYPPPDGVFSLTVTGTEGGLVWPGPGVYAPGATIQISANPLTGFRFVKWQGEGQDSYSGEEPRATIVLYSDITQHALFEPDGSLHGVEASLSASDTDPFVNSDPPPGGPRPVYLWLTCSQGGVAVFESGVASTMPLGQFVPAVDVYNFGDGTDLVLGIAGCPTGADVPRLLGYWVAQDTGGRICLVNSRANRIFATWDCGNFPNIWPEPLVWGFSSDGTAPCLAGENGCGDPTSTSAAAATAAGGESGVTGLTAVAPNPFRGQTEVRFTLARPGAAKVSLFDVAGRLVRVLREGELPAGDHAVAWDGRTASARARAAAGIYFVRFEAAGTRQTERVVFLGE